jgi:hypothetical protein
VRRKRCGESEVRSPIRLPTERRTDVRHRGAWHGGEGEAAGADHPGDDGAEDELRLRVDVGEPDDRDDGPRGGEDGRVHRGTAHGAHGGGGPRGAVAARVPGPGPGGDDPRQQQHPEPQHAAIDLPDDGVGHQGGVHQVHEHRDRGEAEDRVELRRTDAGARILVLRTGGLRLLLAGHAAVQRFHAPPAGGDHIAARAPPRTWRGCAAAARGVRPFMPAGPGAADPWLEDRRDLPARSGKSE